MSSENRIKYALAAAQMVLAWTLIRVDNALALAEIAHTHRCDSPGPTPALEVLLRINAPLVLPRALWEALGSALWGEYPYLSYYWSVGMLIVVVGLLWYWVGLNVQAWRQRRAVLMFSWRPARFVADALFVGAGLVCGLATSPVIEFMPRTIQGAGCYGPMWMYWLSSIISAFALLGWSFVLVVFYGRDFIHCTRQGRDVAVG